MSDTQSDDSISSSIYTQVSHEEHIQLAPDTYVGSIEKQESIQYICEGEDDSLKIVSKKISMTPAVYKIFDEVLVNAADHYTRLLSIKNNKYNVTEIKINLDKDTGVISIYNDGEGIDVCQLEEYDNIWAATLIFGKLLTGGNFDQNEERTVGGKNGYGAKLANIFSDWFSVETVDSKRKLKFYQKYTDHMQNIESPIIEKYTQKPYTRITFLPDYKRFDMDGLEEDTFNLFKKRTYDMTGWLGQNVKIYFNDRFIDINQFNEYVDLYLPKDQERVCEQVNPRWEIVLSYSNDDMFNQVSFVNSICTTRGGKHVDYIVDQLKEKLVLALNKSKKLDIRPNTVKNQLFIFLKSIIVNPCFDSQTKETLTTTKKKFGSECIIDDKIIKKLMKTKIVEKIIKENEYKDQKTLKKNDGKKSKTIVGIPKLCDANKAGTKKFSKDCTLILTEGDSAKTTAVAGLSVVGRDLWGVFPLKGKLLNVKDVSDKKIQANEEITNLVKILGLQYKKEYNLDREWELRYGKIMIMTDQDHDGSHIKGLVMNLFHEHWPSLFQSNFITSMVTPIIKCSSKKTELSFYTLSEYDEWKENIDNIKSWNIKYYKGLGTSNVSEAKKYFEDLNIQSYIYEDKLSNESMALAFDKSLSHKRKTWLSGYSEKDFIDFGKKDITYNEFVNKELIHFSKADCKRSIPDIRDGLKPSQRKVMYSCFKRNLQKDIKVSQLSGYVSENASYHHGEMSLQQSIVGLAQDFIGSNNINLLFPSGQFGSRLKGGKDSASSRYIFTRLSKITKYIFRDEDKEILNYLDDDGFTIEPECYYPIIPMVLINGAKGIGTGHSTTIPNYSPMKIIRNFENRLKDKPFKDMIPFYKDFDGDIKLVKESYTSFGRYEIISDDSIKIVELPIGVWTQDYKEFLDSLVKDKTNDSNKITILKYYNDQCSECKIDFILKFTDTIHNIFGSVSSKLIDALKLKNSKCTNTTNMVLFDNNLILKKYKSVVDIMEEYYHIRLDMYLIRKNHLLKSLNNEANILEDKYKYIDAQVKKELDIINKPELELEKELENMSLRKVNNSYDYLTDMPQKALSKEKVIQLKNKYDKKMKEIDLLESKTPKMIWSEELKELKTVLKSKK